MQDVNDTFQTSKHVRTANKNHASDMSFHANRRQAMQPLAPTKTEIASRERKASINVKLCAKASWRAIAPEVWLKL